MGRLIVSILTSSILLRPVGRVVAGGGGGSNALLLETGDYFLLETATDKLLFE
jgi:hypothetical protein